MFAVVKNEPRLPYTSVVFGHYKEKFEDDELEYYIVLNEENSGLIKKMEHEDIVVLDSDTSDWNMTDDECGQIKFLDSNLPNLVMDDMVPPEVLDKCCEVNRNYDKWKEIQTEEDIKKLDDFCCNFHDSWVSSISVNKKIDSITVVMEDIGLYSVEICFYDWASFNTGIVCAKSDYWFCSSMYFKDGYFCLINEEDCEITPENTEYTWFSGKKAKYRIIPNI